MRKIRTAVFAALAAAGLVLGTAAAAHADAPAGNSGHSDNGSTQCQAGGVDHCPPFGP
jgi:Spy/CpxP family protein refolding chaperone